MIQTRIAINGFGRIGRMVFRQAINDDQLEVAVINARYDAESLAHLIMYDSVHGRFDKRIQAHQNYLDIEGQIVWIVNEREPNKLPWDDYEIDIVIEATGKFNSRNEAGEHLRAGAKKVVITAPGKQVDKTIVMGVNDDEYDPDQHHVVSNASCTTNCLAPVVKILDDAFGIVNGLMTTVHAFTSDQNNLDNPHKDLRRARGCTQSIIPTSTGAAKALGDVIPHLSGKLHGMALRVPTPNVSLVDVVVDVEKPVTVEMINQAFQEAEHTHPGIIQYSEEPLVSIDYTSNEHSAIIDALSTIVLEDQKLKVLAWYDNEWGYSRRVLDLAILIGSQLPVHHATTI